MYEILMPISKRISVIYMLAIYPTAFPEKCQFYTPILRQKLPTFPYKYEFS